MPSKRAVKMLAVVLTLAAAALIFIFFDQPLLGALCLLTAAAIAIAGALSKTGSAAKKIAEGSTKGMWKELQEAETGSPDISTTEQAVSNAGGFAGQQAFAPRKKQLRFKGISGWTELNQKLIDGFKKIFK